MTSRAPDGGSSPPHTRFDLPDFGLVVVAGRTRAQAVTVAAQTFAADEIVRDARDGDETARLADISSRLQARGLVVLAVSQPRAAERSAWLQLAKRHHAPTTILILDPGLVEAKPAREGFDQVFRLSTDAAAERLHVARHPLPCDRRDDCGPFDIIGDVHGCAMELAALLARLGYRLTWKHAGGARSVSIAHPEGRKVVLLGDLVDRGPNSPDVLRIAMGVTRGRGHVVLGNHELKLARWLEGRRVQVNPGLAITIDQLSTTPGSFRDQVAAWIGGLPSHVWLDGGRLAAAHAGLRPEMIGRSSRAERTFCLYGETTGELDDMGAPVRRDWTGEYDAATVLTYGHTPVRTVLRRNNTVCLDTGCVFGGALTALRWPEDELVEVPARQVWFSADNPGARTAGDASCADA